MRGKKGQLGNFQGIILVVVFVGVLLGAGFLILEEFRELDSLTDTSMTVANETNAYINSTGYTVANEDGAKTDTFVITAIWNVSAGVYNQSIATGNATIGSATGIVTNASTTTYSNVSISYTHQTGEEAWEGVNDTIDAMTTIPDLLGLIILIVIVGIILAVVFNVIPTGRVQGA